MAVNDIFRNTVVANYVPSGEEWIFTLDYRQTAYLSLTSPSAQCVEIASDVFANVNTNYIQPVVSDQVQLVRVECFIINNPTFFGNSVQAPVVGGVSGEQLLPFNVAPLWNKLTGLRGRSFRGRNFVFPPVEVQQDAGVLEPFFLTLLQTFADGLLTRTVASGDEYRLTVYSPTLSDPGAGTYLDNIVETIPVNPRTKSRRTRGN